MKKAISVGILCVVDNDNINLSETLESISKQTDFSYAKIYLSIRKNCKNSLNIAHKFSEEFPNNVSITICDDTKSFSHMLADLYKISKETYIVLCAAGDTFTDVKYLEIQSEILKQNPSASGVFCLSTDIKDGSVIPYDINTIKPKLTELKTNYFAKYSMVTYSAIMLRNRSITIPDWYFCCNDAFFPLILMLLGKAKLCLNNANMVEKRSEQAFFPLKDCSENRIIMLQNLLIYFKENYKGFCTKTLKKSIISEINFILTECSDKGNVKMFFNNIGKSKTEYNWLYSYIKEYDITPEQLQLTGNLHREWANLHNLPMVTVVCITYAHEKFIRQALDSFLMQKTNFRYQIFVGEDKGPDGTADIIREYAAKYPDKIVPFIRENNMGAQRNLIDMCSKAQSPYIAFCEGDDYWTDEYKLQKQFDYMESHPTMRQCFHDTEIVDELENGWFLSEQFKTKDNLESDQNKMIWPRSMSGFKPKNSYNAGAYIKQGFVHTSSMFFRWDYTIKIPEWYYTHQLGDFTIWLIQLGKGRFGYIPHIMSVYRRHEGGAYYFNDKTEYMLKTRKDWVSLLNNLENYFIENYDSYKVDTIQKRLDRETNNLLYSTINNLDFDDFIKIVEELGSDSYSVIRWVYNTNHARKDLLDKIPQNLMWYFENIPNSKERLETKIQRLRIRHERQEKLNQIINYWKYALSIKNKHTWVFSGFWGRSYMDNTMYLFEYINKNNPEINAIWISKSSDVVKQIRDKGYVAYLAGTRKATKAMKKAYVGFVDHYRMSDFSDFKGFNHRLKIVQLWHGVGNKKMKDIMELSTIKGSQLSPDIVNNKKSILATIKKLFYTILFAPKRELYEKYLMYVCPGQEMIEDCHNALKIPEKSFFLCGYPRTAHLSEDLNLPDIKKIIYAPTFRWSRHLENIMINNIMDSLPTIQKTMEEINGEFIIRFHPHTWRDYNYKINSKIKNYDRIKIDTTANVYENLSDYFCMISDYSSIVYDFLLLDRPLIFHCPDLEFYINSDTSLKYDYSSVTPGPQTRSWEESMRAVIDYCNEPDRYRDERLKTRDFFYDMSVNDENNSKRIIEEIKRRINF